MIPSRSDLYPQQTGGSQSQQSGDNLKLVLTDLKKTLEGISSAFAVYNDCAEKLQERPSPFPTFQNDVDTFSKEIEHQEYHQQEVFDRITRGLEHDIRKQVELALEDSLSVVIREEAAKIVQDEVDEHIKDHLPVSLKEQVEENTKQLQEIEICLSNSQARTQNSFLERTHLDDPLVPVLKLNGEKSPHYPQTMKRLFEYDLEKVKALSKDYGLTDGDDVPTHYQQILKHIGTSINVEAIPHDLETTMIDESEEDPEN